MFSPRVKLSTSIREVISSSLEAPHSKDLVSCTDIFIPPRKPFPKIWFYCVKSNRTYLIKTWWAHSDYGSLPKLLWQTSDAVSGTVLWPLPEISRNMNMIPWQTLLSPKIPVTNNKSIPWRGLRSLPRISKLQTSHSFRRTLVCPRSLPGTWIWYAERDWGLLQISDYSLLIDIRWCFVSMQRN
jgi:hypothetical protein